MSMSIRPTWIEQPQSTTALTVAQRNSIVISTVKEGNNDVVLSRYGDDQWDLSPFFKTVNSTNSQKMIQWRRVPSHFTEPLKAITYRYWLTGLPGVKRPVPSTVTRFHHAAVQFMTWLTTHHIHRLVDVTPMSCMTYVDACRRQVHTSSALKNRLSAIEILYVLGEASVDRIQNAPWPDSSAATLAGRTTGKTTQSKTDIIPDELMVTLFKASEKLLLNADTLLDARDGIAEKRLGEVPLKEMQMQANRYLASLGLPPLAQTNQLLNHLRSACYIILGMVTGCRNHEIAAVESGASYQSVMDDEVYYWLRSYSWKTYEGETQWMMPEIGMKAVAVMERWSKPYRDELKDQITAYSASIAELPTESEEYLHLVKLKRDCEANAKRLFLAKTPRTGMISTLSQISWNKRLKLFCAYYGVDWKLTTHQLRRTFAVFVAHHVMGDVRYLRHHYKHWSMDMTLLYAKNEKQEEALYDEVMATVRDQKIGVIEHWLDDDALITGGAAPGVKSFRKKHRLNMIPSREALVESISTTVNIRATGHGWCLADGKGCGGQGLYEKTRCVDCSESLIDERHLPVWQGIYEQQLELLEVKDIGPGGLHRAKRDVLKAASVLQGLGVKIEEGIDDDQT